VRVALVGYTNVGKSTLMNLLTKENILAENKLFATVDSTVRKVVLENIPFLISDTVGFIRKLPTHLIESFKSTLSEIEEADLLVHVVDIAHPGFEDQIAVVNQTLREMGAGDKPMIMVFNKIDIAPKMPSEEELMEMSEFEVEEANFIDFEKLKISYAKKSAINPVFMAAGDGTNIAELRKTIIEEVKKIHKKMYPHYLEDEVVDFSQYSDGD
jgi:GTP-binding protein HflX